MYSTDTDYLKETFQYAMDTWSTSQEEAQEVRDMYTNRQYTAEQIAVLNSRGQPIETFNVVLMMIRALTGYLGRVQNKPQIKARTINSNDVAAALNDYLNFVLDDNDFDAVKRKLQLDGLTSGLMVEFLDVIKTGQKDQYGRDIHQIKIDFVPSYQVAPDPMSKLDDGSDFRFFHRFKWISRDNFIQLYGKRKIKGLQFDYNFLDREVSDVNREQLGNTRFGYSGVYKAHEKYLVVHSIIREQNGDYYSVQWSDDKILLRNKITFKTLKNPYIVVKMNDQLDIDEFYSPFREVVESQKAINQALIQIQLLVNTSKAFVEDGAVDDIDKFKESFSRVNSVVEVADLSGVKVEDMSRDILDQYTIIDQALQIQANHAAGMISYATSKIELLMKRTGSAIADLAKQYISAEQVLRTSDYFVGDRYFTINKPVEEPIIDPQTGQPVVDPQTNQLVTQPVMEPIVDPASGDFIINKETGAVAIAPLGDPSSTLSYADVDIKVESVAVDNTNEKDQLILETVVNGPMGQAMLQMNPAGYMMMSSLSLRNYGAKYSNVISDIFQQTALMVNNGQMDPTLAMAGGNMQAILGGAMGGSTGNPQNGPSSQTTQIPTGIDQGGPKGGE